MRRTVALSPLGLGAPFFSFFGLFFRLGDLEGDRDGDRDPDTSLRLLRDELEVTSMERAGL